MDKYAVVRDLGSGSFAVTRLLRNRVTNELSAVKFIQRGPAINENVAKEIMNQRALRHPSIIRFNEVAVTPTHLAVKMEYAAGGNLLERIQKNGRFSEDEARYFFQQLISGISYSHFMQICHRDLKLENIPLDRSFAPRLKICDFGFSSSSLLRFVTSEAVGTPTYMAPEVHSRRKYDGKLADVWSCGVVLYVMLVGDYPFEKREDAEDSNNLIKRIFSAQYQIPDSVHVSQDCRHILSRIFVANPNSRITIKEIRSHPWFLKNLPRELTDAAQAGHFRRTLDPSLQSVEEIMKIVEEARIPPLVSTPTVNVGRNETDDSESDDNAELAINDLQEEFEEKIDSPMRNSNLNSGEDNVGARATKLVQESKTTVNKISKLMFSGDKKDEVVGARATVFVQGKTTTEDSLTSTFSRDGEDIVGTRATKFFQNEIGDEKSFDSVFPSNTRKMDMLGQRATKVSQCESTKVGLARLTVSSSFSEREDIVGTRATMHTFSGQKNTSFTSEFD